MAKVAISKSGYGKVSEIKDDKRKVASVNYQSLNVLVKNILVNVIEVKDFLPKLESIENNLSYTDIAIDYKKPFNVSFTNVDELRYSGNTPAPIGVAIIGVSNYIL